MGLNINTLQYMELLKYGGVNFESVAMLGRQEIFVSDEVMDEIYLDKDIRQEDGYAEKFFKYLGAEKVVSYDYSDYENATYLHDFNLEIGIEHHELYSVVFEGGSLEHIFNFPTAIHNLMKMVKVGGHLVIESPVNNACGHGLYQFSSELFLSILASNGFIIKDITWVDMKAISIVKGEYQIKTYKTYDYIPVDTENLSLILLAAEKVEHTPTNLKQIMQANCEIMWNNKEIEKNIGNMYYDTTRELNHVRGIKEDKSEWKVVFWGAGKDFENFWKISGNDNKDKSLGVIDTDIKKQGCKIFDMEIIGTDMINSLSPDYFVISTSKYYKEIKMMLKYKYEISEDKILSLKEYQYYLGSCIFYK